MKVGASCALLFLFFASSVYADIFDIKPPWKNIRVTFNPKFWNKWAFAAMPLTKTDAESEGFKQLNANEGCAEGQFLGYRYLKDNDPAVILLFDVNGYFAGIQTSFMENEIVLTYKMYKNPMFTVEKINGKNHYTLTAYLIDPAIICTTGRSWKEFKKVKGGTNLYFKNGTDVILAPKRQNEVKGTSWTIGKCFWFMGVHYWYDTSLNMNCDYFQPVFLLYNYGELTGFGFAVPGVYASSRYEHPKKDQFGKFFNPVPKCLNAIADAVEKFTSLHVYMNSKPWNLLC